MKRAFRLLSSTLVTGLLVVIPAWVSLLLLTKLLTQLSALLQPILKLLPPGLIHPDPAALRSEAGAVLAAR